MLPVVSLIGKCGKEYYRNNKDPGKIIDHVKFSFAAPVSRPTSLQILRIRCRFFEFVAKIGPGSAGAERNPFSTSLIDTNCPKAYPIGSVVLPLGGIVRPLAPAHPTIQAVRVKAARQVKGVNAC